MIVYIQCIGYRNLIYRDLDDRDLNDPESNHIIHTKIQLSDLLDYIRTELQIANDVSIVVKHKTKILEPSSQIDNESRLVAQIIKKHNEFSTNEFQRNELPTNQSSTNQFSTNNCKNNCGFYANGTSEYCSKCASLNDPHPLNSIHPMNKFTNNTSTTNQFTTNQFITNQPNQPNQHHCNACHKKIGLLGFLCKCGFKYCGLHRQPEQHECTFDYVSKKRDELRDQLVKCDNNKINKI